MEDKPETNEKPAPASSKKFHVVEKGDQARLWVLRFKLHPESTSHDMGIDFK